MAKKRDEEMSQEDLHPAKRNLLKSLDNHWSRLTLFVDHPEIPMDNNLGERTLRDAVCARKFFFGSYSLWAGQLAAAMFSLCATLEIWKINPRSWLTAYFEACAQHGGKPPPDAARWLPWNLSEAVRRVSVRMVVGGEDGGIGQQPRARARKMAPLRTSARQGQISLELRQSSRSDAVVLPLRVRFRRNADHGVQPPHRWNPSP